MKKHKATPLLRSMIDIYEIEQAERHNLYL